MWTCIHRSLSKCLLYASNVKYTVNETLNCSNSTTKKVAGCDRVSQDLFDDYFGQVIVWAVCKICTDELKVIIEGCISMPDSMAKAHSWISMR